MARPYVEQFQTVAVPSGGGVIRNMMPAADKNSLVLAMSGVNRVGIAHIQ